MQISVRTNIKAVRKNLNIVEKQVFPIATAKALTFTAERAQKAVSKQIPQVFSNPTPKTRKSVFKSTATLKKPTASVFLKDVRGEYRWLQHHIDGGARPQKGSERRNRLAPWTAAGKNMTRNQYGNITRGRYAKMFADSQLTGQFSGDYSSTKTKAKGGTKKISYFKTKTRTGKSMIMWKKNKSTIIPALVETSKPTYRKRWPFYRTVRSVTKRKFPIQLRKSINREVRKLKQPRVTPV
jgi:hypothetical protein